MSQHLYAYTGNNPVNYVDPTGHISKSTRDLAEWDNGEDYGVIVPKSPQIVGIEGADEYGNGLYMSEDDAAYAFAEEALRLTYNDDLERVSMIMPIEVSVTYDDGSVGTLVMYTYSPILTGEHMNCVLETIALNLYHIFSVIYGLGNAKVSFVHTHPCTTDCNTDEFSGKDGKIGDVTVANLPWVNKMYLAESQTGTLWVYNPITNSEDFVADGLFQQPRKKWNDPEIVYRLSLG